ncbi:DNA-binding transcriptional regulator, GntR family [Tranquillimonas rosea]|uniref:DNA-binding transcriptional regulator, GntR family n=1 Tax=Tranquillimonas rosea TaxID=641238 RepID=A0A1H9U9V5_9RHOB|nr:GntR family transcriptional regulator [Tranquillimonas rosea]SES06236.1 DNA-binding transcriptional regulator, GntR family [Tranquillimonas rosea]
MLVKRDTAIHEVDQTAPIGPQVRRALRERIIRNDLKPDQKISESEIAAQYGVSRQPVREAFIRLSDEGLVTILPQRGTRVCRIGLAAVRDARFIRESIEADITRLLADGQGADHVDEFRGLIDAQRRAADTDPVEFIRADEAFHRAMADAVGKGGLWRKVQSLKSQMDRVRFLALGQFPVRKLIDQHAAIVDGIAAGDADGAEVALRHHLREVLSDLPHIVRTNPDFFDAATDGAEDQIVKLKGGETV